VFVAYLGSAAGAKAWEAWLGPSLTVTQHVRLPSGVTRAVATLSSTAAPEGANWIALEPTDTGFSVRVPPASPQPCFVVSAFGGRVLTDDLRLCASLTGAHLDPVGVYAMLMWGQPPAPHTLLRGVTRLAGGHRFDVQSASMTAVRDFIPDPDPTLDPALAGSRVETVLDRILGAIPQHAMLFFSGGVDSSLLAARAAALGRTDIQLLNYAFGPHDPEAAHALRVAAHLRLACERVTHDAGRMVHVLDRLASDYAFPFGDLSALPTNLLVHAALGQSGGRPPVVVEGTGADGAFGMGAPYPRWRAIFALPAPLRVVGAAAYDWLRLWRFNLYAERVLRFVRKSTRLGIRPAVLAQHSLDGIAYRVPSGERALVQEPAELVSPEERLSLLDLAWVCAGRMAPKTFDPLRQHGVRPIYPYLEPDLIQASTSVSWDVKCAGGEDKALLKVLLARSVPKALVYRRKSGFTPPYRTTLASAPLQAFLNDVVLAPDNPMLEFCHVPTIRALVTRVGSGAELSAGGVDFLWTLAFTSGWLRQLPRARSAEHRSVA
jgi:asparagine synthase (glutamine-hydrolysing)